ncbi:hypothetical protein Nepgr_004434 [Nepenthes gracilis]|uniref:Exopolygalacturonase-like n=1 Tax=Nepenthes gracilis TaxID=150966 RepID=A0AAD3XF79_NEPGR|nr:hypothetical protein Nepgr_004434 [Nepenthes gracilis]
MATPRTNELTKVVLFLGLALFFSEAQGRTHRSLAQTTGTAVFDVTSYGAKGDGKEAVDEDGEPINDVAFIQAWNAACHTAGPAKVVIPPGKFVLGQVIFAGPCQCPNPIVEVQGTVIATTDLSQYPSPDWFLFERVDGVVLTGTGTFDGQGHVNWGQNDCEKNPDCVTLPSSIKFHRLSNAVIEGIKSVNSMFFHIFVTGCHNVTVRNVNLVAPFDSPNTDGVHTSISDMVTIADSVIATGDDCVSVGHGSVNVTVTGVTCGPGHGISVGSLGKQVGEKPVQFVHVKNCTLVRSDNGARIKSWPARTANTASDIIFEELIMDHVKNPIIINQRYGCKKNSVPKPSLVKISNVQFKNITGTTITNAVVNIICSEKFPCEGIHVGDIDLQPIPLKGLAQVTSTCSNANVILEGKHDGITCSGAPATPTSTEEAESDLE